MATQEWLYRIKQIPWALWPVAFFVLSNFLFFYWKKRQASQNRVQDAEFWPTVEGRVNSIEVNPASAKGSAGESFLASFQYSYSVPQGEATDYYSGDFSLFLSDEDAAWAWLSKLKDKRVQVHVKPGRPRVSAVLAADLDAVPALASPVSPQSAMVLPEPASTMSPELRRTTQTAASLAALGFCLSLADHLSRLIGGKPLHPQLSLLLWVAFIALMIWFHTATGEFLFGKPKVKSRVPQWLRTCIYALNSYVALFWVVKLMIDAGLLHFHGSVHQLDPMQNGGFLATFYGDTAAVLYGKLGTEDDPYHLSSAGIHPE